MDPASKIKTVESRFASGDLSVTEITLHLEPLLWQASRYANDEKTIRSICNDLELVIFTLTPEMQTPAMHDIFRRALAFVEARAGRPDVHES